MCTYIDEAGIEAFVASYNQMNENPPSHDVVMGFFLAQCRAVPR